MRALSWTAVLSLALIIAIGLFSGGYSHFVSGEMQEQARRVEEAARAGQWEECTRALSGMESAWRGRADILSMWVVHGDVDDVSTALGRLGVAVAARDVFHALLYTAELTEALDHLEHRDAPRLKNIL